MPRRAARPKLAPRRALNRTVPNAIHLQLLNSVARGEPVAVPPQGLVLGRAESSGFVLDARAFPTVSAQHARVQPRGEGWELADLGSTNGTSVNGTSASVHALEAGDLIELGGPQGARLLVVGGEALERTQFVRRAPPAKATTADLDELSATGIHRLRNAMGLPPRATRAQRWLRRAPYALGLVLALALGLVGWRATRELRSDQLDHTGALGELRTRNDALEAQLARAAAQLEEQQQQWEQRKLALERDRDALLVRLSEIEAGGRSSAGELTSLRSELEGTKARLEQYDPVQLAARAKGRLAEVLAVAASVVYIEKREVLRERGGERYLHKRGARSSELRTLAPESQLETLGLESGSGFCISPQGWIATNAHVVSGGQSLGKTYEFEGVELIEDTLVEVVFSGTSTRRAARIEAIAGAGAQDYALLRIVPFEGMPYVRGFALDAPLPATGDEVRLFGFPLGDALLQEGDLYTASVFGGTVSRTRADAYFQVQSAVYPGNSGGPVVDIEGRVIGIVTRVQVAPGGEIASDIGYALPIAGLAQVWPPAQLDTVPASASAANEFEPAREAVSEDEAPPPTDGER